MNTRDMELDRPVIARRNCLRNISAVLAPASAGLLGRMDLAASQQPKSGGGRGGETRSSRPIRPGSASFRTPTLDLVFAGDAGMAQWWLPEVVLPGHTDRGIGVEGPVVWQKGSSAGAYRYMHANPDGRLELTAEVSPLELGWAASLTIANRSSETWPDVVGTVCLLLHPSHFFVDPEWKRTYFRGEGRFLT